MNRQESRDITRQKLRTSAQQVFAREGIGAASIDRIAEKAGYSRGAFYSNYPDKHTLALELLAEWQHGEIALWTSRMEHVDDAEARIEMLAQSFNQFHRDTDRSLLNLELQLEAERSPAFGARYENYLNTLHGEIADLLAVLFQRAGRKPPAEIQFVAHTMRSTTMGIALHGRHGTVGGVNSEPGAMLALFLRAMINLGTPLDCVQTEIHDAALS